MRFGCLLLWHRQSTGSVVPGAAHLKNDVNLTTVWPSCASFCRVRTTFSAWNESRPANARHISNRWGHPILPKEHNLNDQEDLSCPSNHCTLPRCLCICQFTPEIPLPNLQKDFLTLQTSKDQLQLSDIILTKVLPFALGHQVVDYYQTNRRTEVSVKILCLNENLACDFWVRSMLPLKVEPMHPANVQSSQILDLYLFRTCCGFVRKDDTRAGNEFAGNAEALALPPTDSAHTAVVPHDGVRTGH